MGYIIDAIRCRSTQFWNEKVMHSDLIWFPFGFPFETCILKVSNQFLFLCINRNGGDSTRLSRCDNCIDVFKLCIAIRVVSTIKHLGIRLQTVAIGFK